MTPRYNIYKKRFHDWLIVNPDRTFIRWDSSQCPLAQYIKANTNETDVEVGSDAHATINDIIYELPGWTSSFTTNFDRGRDSTLGTSEDALFALNYAL